jgi:hypothetical protein
VQQQEQCCQELPQRHKENILPSSGPTRCHILLGPTLVRQPNQVLVSMCGGLDWEEHSGGDRLRMEAVRKPDMAKGR